MLRHPCPSSGKRENGGDEGLKVDGVADGIRTHDAQIHSLVL